MIVTKLLLFKILIKNTSEKNQIHEVMPVCHPPPFHFLHSQDSGYLFGRI